MDKMDMNRKLSVSLFKAAHNKIVIKARAHGFGTHGCTCRKRNGQMYWLGLAKNIKHHSSFSSKGPRDANLLAKMSVGQSFSTWT
ncbi:hypothetical protein ACTXT7_009941 [Hymenolepis weldensis]